MAFRFFGPIALASIVVCVFAPDRAIAQPRHRYSYPRYGPVSPDWSYPGLPAGPYLGYPVPYAYPWFPGAVGSTWSNGLHLNGPPVPTYGPMPGVFGASDLNHQWRAHPGFLWGYGWIGPYAASPRPRPLSVNVWAENDPRNVGPKHARVYPNGVVVESVPGPATPAAQSGGCLVLSVRVPQPTAEVFVDGVKMAQTGTDRLFESPPLEAGKDYQYELTARWVQGGATHELKKVVTGKPGEVVRVDFP